jgi:FkbM family methyltransferase
MGLMRFYFLRHLLPRPVRRQLGARWAKLLEWEFFRQETRFYKQFIRRGDLVFDVGANIGAKTAAFLAAGARVVAVEPNPLCVEEIKKRNRRALEQGRLTIEAVAGAATPQSVTLRVFEGHDYLTTGSPDFEKHMSDLLPVTSRLITVAAITVDDLIERHGLPDFVKIDVEGMDAEVLKGLHQKPKFLSFEYQMSPDLWENARRCFAEAERLGFTNANVTEQVPRLLLGEWVDLKTAASELLRLFGGSARYGDVIVR